MTRNSTFFLSGKTSITMLSLLAAFSMISGLKVLDDLDHPECPSRYPAKSTTCWHYEDENVAVFASKGDRDSMEDRILFEKNIADSGLSVYAVFDGHGGDEAVKYVTKNFMNVLTEIIKKVKSFNSDERKKKYFYINNKSTLREVLRTIEKELLEEMTRLEDGSGTTATIALIDEDQKLLYIANVGDSRVIMGDENGKAYRLSIDHKPAEPREWKRITGGGGSVEYTDGYRVDGYAVSRALGDLYVKHQNNVIADPDTFIFDLSRYNPKMLVLTSDGVVDVMPDEEPISLAESRLDVKGKYFGAHEIAKVAYKRGSTDNITVLIVKMST